MVTTTSVPRIFGIVARDEPVAVIFRRGPSKFTQQLKWNLVTDEVEAGQWITGTFYSRRCDLSPDGSLLVGAYSNYKTGQGARHRITQNWTAVSRPPYFSALALWTAPDAYNGGGIWTRNKALGLNNHPYEFVPKKPMGKGYRCADLNLGADEFWLYERLLAKRGWEVVPGPGIDIDDLDNNPRRKGFDAGEIRYHNRSSMWAPKTFETWELRDVTGRVCRAWERRPPECVWIDVDHRGRVLVAEEGCIYVWERFPEGKSELIADLNENRFEEISPPAWATKW